SARIDPPPTGAAPGPSARSNGDVPHTLPVQQADEFHIETPVALAEPTTRSEAASAAAMIVFESVTKVYDPDVVALSDVSFVIEKGDFVFVGGASGLRRCVYTTPL